MNCEFILKQNFILTVCFFVLTLASANFVPMKTTSLSVVVLPVCLLFLISLLHNNTAQIEIGCRKRICLGQCMGALACHWGEPLVYFCFCRLLHDSGYPGSRLFESPPDTVPLIFLAIWFQWNETKYNGQNIKL